MMSNAWQHPGRNVCKTNSKCDKQFSWEAERKKTNILFRFISSPHTLTLVRLVQSFSLPFIQLNRKQDLFRHLGLLFGVFANFQTNENETCLNSFVNRDFTSRYEFYALIFFNIKNVPFFGDFIASNECDVSFLTKSTTKTMHIMLSVNMCIRMGGLFHVSETNENISRIDHILHFSHLFGSINFIHFNRMMQKHHFWTVVHLYHALCTQK